MLTHSYSLGVRNFTKSPKLYAKLRDFGGHGFLICVPWLRDVTVDWLLSFSGRLHRRYMILTLGHAGLINVLAPFVVPPSAASWPR